MARLTLSAAEDYNFTLFGISCHAKGYRLTWALNNALGIALEKFTPTEGGGGMNTLAEKHAFYVFTDPETYLEYTLIANRSGEGFFAPEQKKADYFLKIEGDLAEMRKNEMMAMLKKTDVILAAFDMEPSKLRSKQNFLF